MNNDFDAIRTNSIGELEIDEDMLREAYRQIKKDRIFAEANQAKWLALYPDMFVAVYKEELVGVAATAEELAEQLRNKCVPSGRSYWRFLPSKPMDLVVPG